MEPMLHYCTAFPNYGAIQAIVRARTKEGARRAAAHPFYGAPGVVRPATKDEVDWHLGMGGTIIEAA